MLTDELIDENKLNEYRNRTNIRRWWFDNGSRYPLMSRIAARVLEIPAQSAASEYFQV